MTVLSNIITPSNVLTTTNTATVTNKTLTAPTVTGMVVSDGTANGVTYLNGSKVLTSGSALQFNGTALGIGTSVTPSKSLTIYNASIDTEIRLQSSTKDFYLSQRNATGQVDYIVVDNAAQTWSVNNTEGMRLTTTGLGIGTSSPAYKLDVQTASGRFQVRDFGGSSVKLINATSGGNMAIDSGSGGILQIFSNGTETARFDAAFNLLVGTTSTFGKLTTYSTATGTPTAGFFANTASFTSNVLGISCARTTTNATYNLIYAYNDNVSGQFAVRDSGNCVNTNNSYGAISDVKLKENIVDASPKLADLMQVKVRNYNLKTEPEHKQLGVIAQELESVFPAMVEESPDRDKQGNDLGTKTKSVKYSVFVPMLIKALQEQQALIQSLKARLDAANL